MGKQVNFFMVSEDEQQFCEFVLADRRVVFLPEIHDRMPMPRYRSLLEANQSRYPNNLLIWNRGIGEELTITCHGPNNIQADKTNDCLIEFHRSRLHGNILVRGRIWAEMRALRGEDPAFICKNPEFERWYDSIARWIRKRYRHDPKYGFYIGSRASELYTQQVIDLAQALTLKGPI